MLQSLKNYHDCKPFHGLPNRPDNHDRLPSRNLVLFVKCPRPLPITVHLAVRNQPRCSRSFGMIDVCPTCCAPSMPSPPPATRLPLFLRNRFGHNRYQSTMMTLSRDDRCSESCLRSKIKWDLRADWPEVAETRFGTEFLTRRANVFSPELRPLRTCGVSV